ncbi:MAG: DNA polymerase Y family protein, partial [Sphingomonadales bacterium]|nr:DNA polymerase Y family protein [Sphingomonadales bacterium]
GCPGGRGARPRRDSPRAPPERLAVGARHGNALRLAAIDAAAAELGLAAGMTLADARARCPQLATLPHDPAADARALDRVVAGMIAFTPLVTADPPDGAVLDITGCAHLFGGEGELARQAMARSGHAARHALAPNPAAARALARYGAEGAGEDVHALPVTALELPDEALSGLRRAGLRTIGDLARRPLRPLAARFGEAAVLRLRQLLGEAAAPLVPHRLTAPIRAEARFAEPIARTEDVLDVIEDLLGQTAREMEARRLGGRRFVVTLCRSDGAERRLAVETGRPVRAAEPVIRLLRERIETLADPIDPGFGFDAITLAVPHAEPLAARQVGLESGTDESEDSVAALIDRLGVRLGREQIYRLAPQNRHLPEVAQRMAPASGKAPAAFPPRAPDGVQRPLYLLDPPQPIEVIAGVPDGPPQRFRWRRAVHDVRLAEGPERIAAEWWRRVGGHLGAGNAASERGSLTRDYYRIEDTAGRRYWVFRRGLFEEKPDPRWYLHGLFP